MDLNKKEEASWKNIDLAMLAWSIVVVSIILGLTISCL